MLRSDMSLRLKDSTPPAQVDTSSYWESELGPARERAALLEGELSGSVAYCGAGVGLVSEVLPAGEVVRGLVEGAEAIMAHLR